MASMIEISAELRSANSPFDFAQGRRGGCLYVGFADA